jgi:hypothetical protein
MIITSKAKFLCLAACLLWAWPLAAEQPPRAELVTAYRIGTTPPMANYLATHHAAPNAPVLVFPLRKPSSNPGHGGGGGGGGTNWSDLDLQTNSLSKTYAPGTIKIDGITSVGYVPPDTNISVGNGQIVETVNVDYAIYSTSDGHVIQAPAAIHNIFAAAGGSSVCASVDGGDPIVLFDKIDQVWIISQLAYNVSFTNNHICLAISDGPDAAKAKYTAYDISFGKNLPDYPKMGIWATGSTWINIVNNSSEAGVYISANMFSHGSTFIGAQMLGFPLSDVAAVVAQKPFPSLHLAHLQNGTSVYNILPADLEGNPDLSSSTSPAPSGTDEYFMQFTGSNTLTLYQFKPDFNGGTGAISSQSSTPVKYAFHEACGGGACVPQLGTSTQLDSLGDRLMYRLSYRNNGSTQSMVVTHSVQMNSSSNATGVRWYQLTATGATTTNGWVIGQEGTFGSTTDGNYRWMGSIAQDKVGDLGIGYSVSGPTMYPGLAYTGQAQGDSANSLEPETLLKIGAGYQNSVNRWGDYSSMSVDPADDCTMWYANEYLKSNGSYTNWGTYIVEFKFSGCQ